MAEQYGEDTLYGGGLRIYTTLDLDMQQAAWDAVTSTLDQEGDPDAALVAVDEYGYVKAMVGGRDFEDDEVNLALREHEFGLEWGGSGRGAGLVVQAVRAGRGDPAGHLAQLEVRRPRLDDLPRRARGEAGRGLGGRQLRRHRAGRARPRRRHPGVVEHRLRPAHARGRARRRWPTSPTASGVSAELPAVPSLVLGTGDVSPLDMAVGYSTFANRGVHNEPVMIAKIEQVDEDGDLEVIDQAVPTRRPGAHRGAGRPRHLLPARRSSRAAPAPRPTIGKPAAGKTGTTQDNKDAWFVGYTPELTAAVWMGYADPLARRRPCRP